MEFRDFMDTKLRYLVSRFGWRKTFREVASMLFAVLLYSLFSILYSPAAEAAILYFSPEAQQVFEQSTFVVELRLDTEGEAINAADITIFFPQNVLEVLDLNTGGSIFSLYPTKPSYFNTLGSLNMQAGAPNGFEGTGAIAKIFFRAKARGEATLRFSQDSKVYLNDGFGTLADVERKEGEFPVAEGSGSLLVIQSPDYPDENAWYQESTITMSWRGKEGASYSYVLTTNAEELPDEVPEKEVGEVTFIAQEDGIYYFHLRECVEEVCGQVRTRLAMRDTVSPEPFKIQLGQEPDAFGGNRFLSFVTTDNTSGVDHYEIRGIDAEWVRGESPYVLADDFLAGAIQVKAADKAGNERVESIIIEEPRAGDKNFSIFAAIFGILIAIGAVLFVLRWKRK